MPEPTDIVTYAETGDIEAAKKLLDWADAESVLSRGAVLELRDPLMSRTAIHRAAEFGHAKFVKFLLDAGVDHTTVDNTGETPLHLAAVNGHADAAKVLIDFDGHAKIALRKVNNDNEAPIHWAALKGHTAVLKLFIAKGGDEMKEFSGKNLDRPLHYAAMNNHEQATSYLLRAHASTLAQNKDGETPLHLAAKRGALSSLHALVSYMGKDSRNPKNKDGKTPMDLASSGNVRDILNGNVKEVAAKMTGLNITGNVVGQGHKMRDEQAGIKPRKFSGGGRTLDVDQDYDY
eukprot:jgi/Tetstr1/430626/TSEL_020419.t1